MSPNGSCLTRTLCNSINGFLHSTEIVLQNGRTEKI